MDAANIRFGKILNNIKLKVSILFDNINRDKRRNAFLSIIFVLIIVGLVFPVGAAHAFWDEAASGIMNFVIYPLIYIIFWVLFYLARTIAWIGASLISANLSPEFMNAVLTSSGIQQGWEVFRDIANLLFILILLLVALGTIFRSSTYNIKKSLPMLIMVAFLINFSMMLTGVIIDFTNILMYGILKMMCVSGDNQCFQNFYKPLMSTIDKLDVKYTLTAGVTWSGITAQSAVGMAVATIYTFVFGIILMALAVFVMLRVAVLALLLILSPLAFFGQVAPGLKGLSDKWWDNLLEYSFFGPIFALFIYISGLMAVTTLDITPNLITNNPNLSTFGELFAIILTSIIPLIFLYMIIPITKSMGIAGANAVYGGAAVATFGGMAAMGRAWGQGKLFPGQQHITNAGNKVGNWAGRQALKNKWINQKWNGGGMKKVGYAYYKNTGIGLKSHLQNAKSNLKNKARGVKVGKYTTGGAYDWMAAQRAQKEKKMFGETKSIGQYAEMGMRAVNPVLLEMKYKDWLKNAYHDNYKIPLGSNPNERRRIELMEANKSISELKAAGGLDNPDIVADKAADELIKGGNLEFEILTKLLAAQGKQYKVLASINRKTGTNYSEDGEGWGNFMTNQYAKKVGTNQASVFGQVVGNSAANESDWTAGNISYYDKNTGENKIRDIGVTGSRTAAQQTEYMEYVKKNAEAMGKKSIGSKWNNMAAGNIVRELAAPAHVDFQTEINHVLEPISIDVNHEANEQGIEYVNGHMTIEEIEKNVGKGRPEELKKIRDGLAYTFDRNQGAFTDPAKAQKLRDRLTVVIGKS